MPHLTYLLRRLGMALLVVLLATTLLAALVHLIPGDPVKIILGPRADAAFSARVRSEMGLDQPILLQIVSFVRNTLRGDLGTDFVSHVPVLTLIGAALPHTVVLALASLGLAALIGIPLGVYSATRPNT
jgi:peptide/nickel transport system permease protein